MTLFTWLWSYCVWKGKAILILSKSFICTLVFFAALQGESCQWLSAGVKGAGGTYRSRTCCVSLLGVSEVVAHCRVAARDPPWALLVCFEICPYYDYFSSNSSVANLLEFNREVQHSQGLA